MKARILIILTIVSIFITCKQEDPAIPVGTGNQIVIEQQVDSISYWNALYNGTISNVHERTISEYGHCWDTLENPNLSDNKTTFKNIVDDAAYLSLLNNLQPDKNYFIRSYFIKGTDTAFSSQNEFFTLKIKIPELIKYGEPETDLYSAVLKGKITDIGGEIVTKGFYYSDQSTVTPSDLFILNQSDTNIFTDTIKELKPNTTYYAKVAASNRAGIGLSGIIEFKTLTKLAELATIEPTEITTVSCKTGGNITDDYGSAITKRGVCYSAESNPTIDGSTTTDGTDKGEFISIITGLSPATKYYIRAYAKNSSGVNYGNEHTITTQIGLPQISTINVTEITTSSALCGGAISSNGGTTILSKGVCWSNSENPTIDDDKTVDGSGDGSFTSSLTGLTENTVYYIRAYATNNSGTAYGDGIIFRTSKEIAYGSVTDYDGNTYKTVTIGSQVWMAEHLKVTHYPNGAEIPFVTNNSDWGNLGDNDIDDAYCYPNNNANNERASYGALYTYAAAKVACPAGWHLPSDEELTTFENFISSDGFIDNEGLVLKAKNGWEYNGNGSDYYGFAAMPSGQRIVSDEFPFNFFGSSCWMWSSTETLTSKAYYRVLNSNQLDIYRYASSKSYGLSVRCIKD